VATTAVIKLGTMVCFDANGFLVSGANTSGYVFAGIALEHVDNLAGLDGALSCRVRRTGIFKFAAATTMSQAKAGAQVDLYLSDNQTVTDVANYVYVGRLAMYESASVAHLQIDPAIVGMSATVNGGYFTIVAHLTGACGHAASNMLEDFEMPFAFTVLRGYAKCQTAPSGSYVCTIAIAQGATTAAVTITGAAVKGENEAMALALAANTDTDITAIDDHSSGNTADIDVIFVCQATA
jgi:hypothetical protein